MKNLLLLVWILFFIACSKDKKDDQLEIPKEGITLSCSTTRFTFPSDGGRDSLSIFSNYTWSISSSASWCSPSVTKGQENLKIQISVEANPSQESREAIWIVSSGNLCQDTIYISQSSKDGKLYFPDKKFEKYLLKNFDRNHDGILSESEAKEVRIIDIQDDYLNLDGLYHLPELQYLKCAPNSNVSNTEGIKELNISKNFHLLNLICSNNQLTELDITQNLALEKLDCHNNQLLKLDLSNHQDLREVNCSDNQLAELNVNACTSLNSLTCSDNKLTSLDISSCSSLRSLSCDNNQLATLTLGSNATLEYLTCSNNQLTFLELNDLPQLRSVNCANNPIPYLKIIDCPLLSRIEIPKQLSSLEIVNNDALISFNEEFIDLTSVKFKNCSNLKSVYIDGFKKIDSLSLLSCDVLRKITIDTSPLIFLDIDECAELEIFNCFRVDLKSINLSKHVKLTEVICEGNPLVSLNVNGCSSLTTFKCDQNELTDIDVRGCTALDLLWCGSNHLEKLDVSDCTSLTYLACSYNQLKILKMNDHTMLKHLECRDNQLVTLELGDCTSLEILDCQNNQLVTLDVSGCIALKMLYCANNPNLKTIYKKKGQNIDIEYRNMDVEIIEK